MHQSEHLVECPSICFSVVIDEASPEASASTIVESSVEHTTILTSDLWRHLVNCDLEEPIRKWPEVNT